MLHSSTITRTLTAENRVFTGSRKMVLLVDRKHYLGISIGISLIL